MRRVAVDASILIKLYFEEEHSDVAADYLGTMQEVLAPDLIWVEAANVVWKRYQRGEIDQPTATEAFTQLSASAIKAHSSRELMADALEIACQFHRSVYDSTYVALAVQAATRLVTADRRLANALKGSPLEANIVWIGDCG